MFIPFVVAASWLWALSWSQYEVTIDGQTFILKRPFNKAVVVSTELFDHMEWRRSTFKPKTKEACRLHLKDGRSFDFLLDDDAVWIDVPKAQRSANFTAAVKHVIATEWMNKWNDMTS